MMTWADYYPAYTAPEGEHQETLVPRRLTKDVTVADIGCGFGGLLVALAPQLPDELVLGEYDKNPTGQAEIFNSERP